MGTSGGEPQHLWPYDYDPGAAGPSAPGATGRFGGQLSGALGMQRGDERSDAKRESENKRGAGGEGPSYRWLQSLKDESIHVTVRGLPALTKGRNLDVVLRPSFRPIWSWYSCCKRTALRHLGLCDGQSFF